MRTLPTSSLRIDVAGKRYFSPTTIAVSMLVLGLPFALLLYGINLFRFGDKAIGALLGTLSTTILLSGIIANMLVESTTLPNSGGVFMALGLYQLASPVYEEAKAKGALSAPWLVPLLIFMIMALISGVITMITLDYLAGSPVLELYRATHKGVKKHPASSLVTAHAGLSVSGPIAHS